MPSILLLVICYYAVMAKAQSGTEYTAGARLYCLPIDQVVPQPRTNTIQLLFDCKCSVQDYAATGYFWDTSVGAPTCVCANNIYSSVDIGNCTTHHLLNSGITTCVQSPKLGCGNKNGQYATVWMSAGTYSLPIALTHTVRRGLLGDITVARAFVSYASKPPFPPYAENKVRRMTLSPPPTYNSAIHGALYDSGTHSSTTNAVAWSVVDCMSRQYFYSAVTEVTATSAKYYCMTDLQAKVAYNARTGGNVVDYVGVGTGLFVFKTWMTFGLDFGGTNLDCGYNFFSQVVTCENTNLYDDLTLFMRPVSRRSTLELIGKRGLIDSIGCVNQDDFQIGTCSGSYSYESSLTTEFSSSVGFKYSLENKQTLNFLVSSISFSIKLEATASAGFSTSSSYTSSHELSFSEPLSNDESMIVFVFKQNWRRKHFHRMELIPGGYFYLEGLRLPFALLDTDDVTFPVTIETTDSGESVFISMAPEGGDPDLGSADPPIDYADKFYPPMNF